MARKEITFIIEDETSRDYGKEFLITEMSAMDGQELAGDIFRIMGESGFTGIPDDVINMGSAGLATLGMSVVSAASKEASREMRDRLLATAKLVCQSDKGPVTRKLNPKIDFEEISSIQKVMDQVFKINFDFLTKGER